MAGLLEAAHELVEEDHLAGGDHEAVHGLRAVPAVAEVCLRAAEEEGVVAALLQLRDDVQQRHLRPTLCPLRPQETASDCITLHQIAAGWHPSSLSRLRWEMPGCH